MKRAAAVLAALIASLPASAFAGNLTFRFGGFFPRAESNLFADASEFYTLYTGFGAETPPGLQPSDWNDFTFGAAYFTKVANGIELGVSIDGYNQELDTAYREFVREDDSEIYQTLRLTIVPMSLAVRFTPTSSRKRIAPYLEIGGDAIYYKYEEYGDFIDFFDPSLPVVPDSFYSDGWGFGFHAAAGLKVPVTRDFSIVGEGRYQWAKDDMDDDFRSNEIDLSGWSATIGFNIRF